MLVYTGLRRKIGSGSPTSIPGLVGWWKQGDWTSSGERVSDWNDSSGTTYEPYVAYQGVSGQYASAPDTAAFEVAGDISLMARVRLEDWSPGALVTIGSKWHTTGNNRAYKLSMSATDRLTIGWSTNGTVELADSSTAALTVTDATYIWVMVTLDVVSGADRVSRFYQAADSTSVPTAWTLVDTVTTGGGATSIYAAGTALLNVIGIDSGTAERMTGRVKRFLVYSGLVAADGTGGTMIADYNPSIQADAATSWVSTSPTGETWTQQGATMVRASKDLRQYSGTAQPIELPWSGKNYAWFPGTTGNNVSWTADSITGNWTLEMDMASDVLAALVSNVDFFTHRSGNNGFSCALRTTGLFHVVIGDGASSTTYQSTATLASAGIVAFQRFTLRIEYIDGASGSLKWYINGVQLGAPVATTKTLVAFAGTASCGPTANNNAMKIYSVSLTNGAGTTYYAVDFTSVAEGTTSIVQNGDTYTINATGAKQCQIVGSPQIVGDDSAMYMRAVYDQAQPLTRFILYRRNTNTAIDYIYDGATGVSGGNAFRLPIGDTATITAAIVTGTVATPTSGNWIVQCGVFNGASSVNYINTLNSGEVNAGSSTSNGFTLFGTGTATTSTLAPAQIKEVIEYNRALSTTEVTTVLRYLSRKGNLGLAI